MALKTCTHRTLFYQLSALARYNETSNEFKSYLQEEIFKKPNQKAFNEIIRFLLYLIDPKKAKIKLPWPLLDKKTEQEFRRGVKELVDDLKDNKDFNIQPIAASMLHSPFGDKIVKFLSNLASFVLNKQLKDKFNVLDEVDQPNVRHPLMCKVLVNLLKEKIICDRNSIPSTDDIEAYFTEASCKLSCAKENIQEMEPQIKNDSNELKNLINESSIDNNLKQCMLENNKSAFEEFASQVNEKNKTREAQLSRLKQFYEKCAIARRYIEDAIAWKNSPPCLDKHNLLINNIHGNSEKLSNLCNENGELSLEGLVAYGKNLTIQLKEIIKTDTQENMLTDWKSYSNELENNVAHIRELESLIKDKLAFVKNLIIRLQSEVYPQYEDYDAQILPEAFFESPTLNMNERLNSTVFYQYVESPNKLIIKIKQKLAKRRRSSLLCSVKHRPIQCRKMSVSKIPSLIKRKTKVAGGCKSNSTASASSESERVSDDAMAKSSLNNRSCLIKKKNTYAVYSPNKPGRNMKEKKKRRSGVSISPKLDIIVDNINDISFTEADGFFLTDSGSGSSTRRSSDYWVNKQDLQTQKESSFIGTSNLCVQVSQPTEMMDSFSETNLLDISSADSFEEEASSNIYLGTLNKLDHDKKKQELEKQPKRRDSLQALIDRYNSLKTKKHGVKLINACI